MPKKYYQPGGADQKRPAPLPTQRGPLHNAGTRGLYDYNGVAPIPPSQQKKSPANRGAQ